MYKCEYFAIHELVPKHIHEKWGEKAWRFLDEKALITIDKLRERYGQITINDYFWGGAYEWSGLRTPDCPVYSETSDHSYGRAFDCKFKTIHAVDVRFEIQKFPDHDAFKYINSIELDVGWLHFATNNVERIMTFKP